ncbi:hypothetical protein [Pseudobacillus badius]|uniref:hypothetical protein n=1 Tax=Bacillus badius TaxID=1455 RepID=UPI0007B38437|nr:hypothetical protein [Bacillus badius]KZR57897.1 hypothetical protein A3781_19160 [Bacillus badius]
MSILVETLDRISSQKESMLELLQERGDKGAYNYELAELAMSYQRRIGDLVEQGYDIKVTCEGGGVYRYTLVGLLEPSKRDRKPILELIIREIEEKYNGSIDAAELLDVIDNVGAIVSYKGAVKLSKK